MATNIKAKANDYVHSYAKAGASGVNPGTKKMAEAVYGHCVQKNFITFTHGNTKVMDSNDAGLSGTKRYLDKWVELGIGLDIRLARYRIAISSSTGAVCFVTWIQHPPPGAPVEGWEWENVYLYRLLPGQDKGHWEAVISDNEVGGLLQRFPKFMESMFEPS